jgi:hypothetical protein
MKFTPALLTLLLSAAALPHAQPALSPTRPRPWAPR